MSFRFRSSFILLVLGSSTLHAQTTQPDTSLPASALTANEKPLSLDTFVTTGTRFNGRLVPESPVPIDVISNADLTVGGYPELQRMLRARVPAFSVPNTVGAGAVDFANAPSLRGLGRGQLRERGVAILMATHDLFCAKEDATRVGIMRHGQLVCELSAAEISHTDLEKLYLETMRA